MESVSPIVPGFPNITKAPDLAALQAIADSTGRELSAVMAEERKQRYGSRDSDGVEWLIRNPVAWQYRETPKHDYQRGYFIRPAPEPPPGGQSKVARRTIAHKF